MTEEVLLVDRGRGLRLSNSRITVLDLIPYFQQGCAHEEIMRWLPTLSSREITLVEDYYRQHQADLDEQDRRARTYRAEQIRLQRLRFPDSMESKDERLARLKQLLYRQHNYSSLS